MDDDEHDMRSGLSSEIAHKYDININIRTQGVLS